MNEDLPFDVKLNKNDLCILMDSVLTNKHYYQNKILEEANKEGGTANMDKIVQWANNYKELENMYKKLSKELINSR